ncbi:hypothetical protein E2320_009264 [Naja naja]|nr:hypothetical protein E2320_009264 [Naja naja]
MGGRGRPGGRRRLTQAAREAARRRQEEARPSRPAPSGARCVRLAEEEAAVAALGGARERHEAAGAAFGHAPCLWTGASSWAEPGALLIPSSPGRNSALGRQRDGKGPALRSAFCWRGRRDPPPLIWPDVRLDKTICKHAKAIKCPAGQKQTNKHAVLTDQNSYYKTDHARLGYRSHTTQMVYSNHGNVQHRTSNLSATKEDWLLGNYGKLAPKICQANVTDFHSIDFNAAP